LSGLKVPNIEPLIAEGLITTLLILPTPLLMKTMNSEVLEGHLRDDFSDLKIEALEFDGNLKPENYIN